MFTIEIYEKTLLLSKKYPPYNTAESFPSPLSTIFLPFSKQLRHILMVNHNFGMVNLNIKMIAVSNQDVEQRHQLNVICLCVHPSQLPDRNSNTTLDGTALANTLENFMQSLRMIFFRKSRFINTSLFSIPSHSHVMIPIYISTV